MEIGFAFKPETARSPTLSEFVITGDPDGTLIVANLSGGNFSITVNTPVEYAGTYTTDTSGATLAGVLLDAGPVCLVVPTISGTTGLGGTLTVIPGLWVYDGNNAAPTSTYQWQSGGADIVGATAPTFDITAAEQGTAVTVEETVTGANGARTTESNPVAVPGGSTMEFAQVSTATSTSTGSAPHTLSGMAIGAPDPGRNIVASVAYGLDTSETSITGVTIGGVAATPIGSVYAHRQAQVEFWQATVPTGTTADVVLTVGSAARGITVTLHRVVNGTVGAAVAGTGFGQVTIDVSADVVNGGAVVAALAVRTSSSGNPAIPGVSWVGITSDGNGASIWSNNFQETASQSVGAGETPRTISVAPDSTDARQFAVASLPINPA